MNHGASPTTSFWLPPSLIMPPKYSIQVWGWGYMKEGLTRSCFHAEFLEFQSYSRHRNHFDIDSKQTHSEEIQVIPMKRFSEVMKTFCFAFGEKHWHLVGKKWFNNLRVSKNQSSKHSFFFIKCKNWIDQKNKLETSSTYIHTNPGKGNRLPKTNWKQDNLAEQKSKGNKLPWTTKNQREHAPLNKPESHKAINLHKEQTSKQWKHLLGDPKN